MPNNADDREQSYTLSYPLGLRLGRWALALLLAVVALIRWGRTWVEFISPLFDGARLSSLPLRPLLGPNLGLLFTAASLALLFALLPDLALSREGLLVRGFAGWRTVPWSLVTEVRTVSFKSGRTLVLVQGRWRWGVPWSSVVSLLLGAGFDRGVLFAWPIRDFAALAGRVREHVAQANPHALFDDEFFSLPARLTFEPVTTLAGLAGQAREEGWPTTISVQSMAAVSGGMILVQLLVLGIKGGVWWKPLVLAGAGLAEWGAGMAYLYALGAVLPGNATIRESLLLYPVAQVPRALLALPMVMFVSAGLLFAASAVGLLAVLWAVLLTALLVQQMYRLPSILPALAVAAIQALFQFMVLALVFGG